MEKIASVRIDDCDLDLVEGAHAPSPRGIESAGEGKRVMDLDNRWDGWIDVIVSPNHEEQIYRWLVKDRVHLAFKTKSDEYHYSAAKVSTKEESDDGIRVIVEYFKD